MESHLGQLSAKLVLKLVGISSGSTDLRRWLSCLIELSTHCFFDYTELCQDFEAETGRVETGLDPINCPVKDDVAMNMLWLDTHLDSAVDYLARL